MLDFCPMVMGATVNCFHLGAGTVWWSIGLTVVLVFACAYVRLCEISSQDTQLMTTDLRDVSLSLLQGTMQREIMITV